MDTRQIVDKKGGGGARKGIGSWKILLILKINKIYQLFRAQL